jgi:hypothetical protein
MAPDEMVFKIQRMYFIFSTTRRADLVINYVFIYQVDNKKELRLWELLYFLDF